MEIHFVQYHLLGPSQEMKGVFPVYAARFIAIVDGSYLECFRETYD